MTKVGIIGTGAYGSALAKVLIKNGHKVSFYGIDKTEIEDLKNGLNTKYFKEASMNWKPDLVTDDFAKFLEVNNDFLILAIPSRVTHIVFEQIRKISPHKKHNFVNLSKGFDPYSGELLSLTLNDKYADVIDNYAALIGPSFAIEVFNESLTMVNIVSENIKFNKLVSKAFTNENFKVLTSNYLIELQAFSVLKNIYALATGIVNAQFDSYNTLMAVLTLAFDETHQYIKIVYGKSNDVTTQLASFGDFVLTATSLKSRNFTFGNDVGKYGLEKTLVLHQGVTCEGQSSLATVVTRLGSNLKSFPLLNSLYDVFYKNKNATELLDFLN